MRCMYCFCMCFHISAVFKPTGTGTSVKGWLILKFLFSPQLCLPVTALLKMACVFGCRGVKMSWTGLAGQVLQKPQTLGLQETTLLAKVISIAGQSTVLLSSFSNTLQVVNKCKELQIFTFLRFRESKARKVRNNCCCFTGKYIYMKSSPPSMKGNVAQLKSSLLPPAGEKGYCLRFWYHMFGMTVGSLRMFLLAVDPFEKTLVRHTWN